MCRSPHGSHALPVPAVRANLSVNNYRESRSDQSRHHTSQMQSNDRYLVDHTASPFTGCVCMHMYMHSVHHQSQPQPQRQPLARHQAPLIPCTPCIQWDCGGWRPCACVCLRVQRLYRTNIISGKPCHHSHNTTTRKHFMDVEVITRDHDHFM